MKTAAEYIEDKFGIKTKLYDPKNNSFAELITNGNSESSQGITTQLDCTQFILINKNLPFYEQKATFFHEVGHCFFDSWNDSILEIRQKGKIKDMSVSEFFAELFAVFMYSLEIHREIIIDEAQGRRSGDV